MSESSEKIHLAWLCHYSLENLRDKIAIDLDGYNAHPATWIYELSKGVCADSSTELHIITVSNFLERDTFFQENNLSVYAFSTKTGRGMKGLRGKIRRYQARQVLYNKIRYRIRKIQPDIITIHGTEHSFTRGIVSLGYPTLLWVQGVMQVIFKEESTRVTKRLIAYEDELFTRLRNFICAQPHIQEIIRKKNPEAHFHPLFYPVNPLSFHRIQADSERMVDFTFSGNLLKRKGIEDMIQALAVLRESHPNISARIIGSAPDPAYGSYLEKMIRDFSLTEHLQLTGHIREHSDLLHLLKHTRVYVYPSHADTAPLSLAEAMSAGLAILASNVDGIPAMIKDGENGFLFEKGNIKEMAEKMAFLLDQREKATSLGHNAREFALKHFELSSVVEEYLRLCRVMANKA